MDKRKQLKKAVCLICGKSFTYCWPQTRAKFCSRSCCLKDWANRHHEEILERNRRYRTKNAETRRETLRKYHAGKGKTTARLWRQKNWDRLLEKLNERYHTDKEYRKKLHARQEANRILRKSSVKYECCGCGSTKRLHCHHVNLNTFDNDLGNLMWLCHWCHMRVHSEERRRTPHTQDSPF